MGEVGHKSGSVSPSVLLRSKLSAFHPSDPVEGDELSPPGSGGGEEPVPALHPL